MKKIKLVESVQQVGNDNQVLEHINKVPKPNFSILDVTVIPDEEYNPTVQSILIDLVENQSLNESDTLGLRFNILSETENEKTGYSHSLFEFESKDRSISLNLSLSHHDKYPGVFNVEARTTRGELVFESNTQYPAKEIKNYLNNLSFKYLKESEQNLSQEEEIVELEKYIKSQEDWIKYLRSRNPNHGDISFAEYQLYSAKDRLKELQGNSKDDPLKEGYSLGDDEDSFKIYKATGEKANQLVSELKSLGIDDVVTVNVSDDHVEDIYLKVKGFSDKDYRYLVSRYGGDVLENSDGVVEEISLYASNSLKCKDVAYTIKTLLKSKDSLDEADDEPIEEQSKQETKPITSTFFIRRPANLEELQEMVAKRLVTKATYSVVDEISLSNEEYDNYTSNLRQDVKFLSTFRPDPENTDYTVIAVKSEDRPTLLIDNSGYDSAQYVGIL